MRSNAKLWGTNTAHITGSVTTKRPDARTGVYHTHGNPDAKVQCAGRAIIMRSEPPTLWSVPPGHSFRINELARIRVAVEIGVFSPFEPNRIAGYIPPGIGIIIPMVVVVSVALH